MGETELPDGRRLGWAEWGPPDGIPVVLIPGAATSRLLGFGPAAVDALGVRLVSVDRPGLGVSTPAPAPSFAGFAADMQAFVQLHGLGRPAMVGNSQGAPFALACAIAGCCSVLALVSAADEVASSGFAHVLPPPLRGLVDGVVADPAGAERYFAGFSPDAVWSMVGAASPPSDLAVYTATAFHAAYLRALADGFRQGPDGYARDTVLAMSPWPLALESITVPVDVWYGAEDTSHSPDRGETLAARIPDARRHVVPGIGGAVLWTNAEMILRHLLVHTY
ncbi:alpha/beta fold hydrolase [Pseudonocardia sp. GCM10023141]|uniref:alpha/beta fold hydrolase n=1 Tax=Pseudonocardia sp. GCM10023141 TaxID=3252653 RepID=UPI00360A8828